MDNKDMLGFDDCVKAGGKVSMKKMAGSKMMKVCMLDGKSFNGSVNTAKTTTVPTKGSFMRAAKKSLT